MPLGVAAGRAACLDARCARAPRTIARDRAGRSWRRRRGRLPARGRRRSAAPRPASSCRRRRPARPACRLATFARPRSSRRRPPPAARSPPAARPRWRPASMCSSTTAPSPWRVTPSTTSSASRAGVAVGLPVVAVDVPADVPVAQALEHRPARAGRRRRRRRGSETTAADRRRWPRRSSRPASVTEASMPSSVSKFIGACDFEWLPMVWPAAAIRRARSGLAAAHRPCRKKLARAPAAVERVQHPLRRSRLGRPVRVLGVDRERHPHAHSRVVTFPASANSPGTSPRERASRQASSCAGTVASGGGKSARQRADR